MCRILMKNAHNDLPPDFSSYSLDYPGDNSVLVIVAITLIMQIVLNASTTIY